MKDRERLLWLQTLQEMKAIFSGRQRNLTRNLRNARFIPKDQLRRVVSAIRSQTTNMYLAIVPLPDYLKGQEAKEKYALRRAFVRQVRLLERAERTAGLRGIKLPRWRNRRYAELLMAKKNT